MQPGQQIDAAAVGQADVHQRTGKIRGDGPLACAGDAGGLRGFGHGRADLGQHLAQTLAHARIVIDD